MNTLPRQRIPVSAAKIIELRDLIARHSSTLAPARSAHLPTGVPALDEALSGGLWKGGLLEVTGSRHTCGSASLLRAILSRTATEKMWAALIDGADTFDPKTAGPDILSRLLWIRCHSAAEAVQSADLLLRDGNLPLVCLDLRHNSPAQLRKIASTTWYRLQRMLEPSAIAFLALTPSALVPCADIRLSLDESRFSLEALDRAAPELIRAVRLQVLRKRTFSTWSTAATAASGEDAPHTEPLRAVG